MEVFVDVITRSGRYVPARIPTWVDAGVGRVVPFACRYAIGSGLELARPMAVYHIEESRFLEWPGFTETCVRDYDTLVVAPAADRTLADGKGLEGFWLVTDGPKRRAYYEARARLRVFENGRRRAG